MSEKELSRRFVREQGFFDKSPTIRFVIVAVFMLCLFLMLHFREVRVDVLELNALAEKYVVAQIDFKFFDQEATALHRTEAARDIGKIYRISEKDVRQRRLEFENFLKESQDWRKEVEKSTFEEMYQAVDVMEAQLLRLRFTDPRTRQKMEETGMPVEDYVIFTPANLDEPMAVPNRAWQHIKSKKDGFDGGLFQEATVAFLLRSFKDKQWNFEEDITAKKAVLKILEARVPSKFTRVSAGDRIIDQGEQVGPQHLAMLQAMKNALGDARNLWSPLTLMGSLLLATVFTAVTYLYFYATHRELLYSNRKLFLLGLIIVLTLGVAKVAEYFLLKTTTNLLDIVHYPILVPLAGILTCVLFSTQIAIYVAGLTSVVLMSSLAIGREGFLAVNLITAVVVIIAARSLRHRREIFRVCLSGWVMASVIMLAYHLSAGSPKAIPLVTDIFSSAIFMGMTAILAIGFLPFFESSFQILTDVALMEYIDPSNEVLRRLSMEAPGTYQHSVVVGNLSEAAAVAIGANGLFCRASTLYHDIGKLMTPQYFTENQQGGMNMHQLLTPLESAQVIIAHVSEGVAMARKMGLPEPFIDIIKEHHGTTLVYYFYHKQVEQMGGDASLVDEADFRYGGPKPRSKESAIIMIADSFEAASRSLEEADEDTLSKLIDRLVADKAADGQFDECELTFEELGIVKAVMVKTLVAARHSRVKYPEKLKQSEDEEGEKPSIALIPPKGNTEGV